MIKTIEDVSATKKRLHIEIPSDAFETEISDTLKKLRASVRLPGFRQGKAPIGLIERRFGKDAEAEAVEKVIPRYYSMALKEAGLRPVTSPVFEGTFDFKRNTPISITLLVETMPVIEGLVYEGVRVKDIPAEITEEDVELTLKRLRDEKAVYVPSEDPVADGDIVVMDYEVKEDGKSFKDEVFKVGSDLMPAEFSENLKGAAKSDNREFRVAFQEDYYSKEMAGRELTFSVTVKDVKKVELPEVDDEFAKDLGYDDLGKLREKIRERLEKSKQNTVSRMLKAEVLKNVLDAHDFEAPESLVRAELGMLVQEARSKGRKESDEVLEEEYRPAAERQIKASLLLQIIADKENLTVTEEEVSKRAEEISAQLNLTPENVIKYYVARDGSLDGLRSTLLEDKVLNILLERAVIEKGE